jgi:uroporphyrinogen III methyltransferase/synthase
VNRPVAGATETDGRPLAGRCILVTRPSGQAGSLVEALRELGAEAVVRPGIEVRPLEDTAELDRALSRLGSYDWVVFTSASGVRHVWERMEALGMGLEEALEDGEHGRRPGQPCVAAIGPGTAAALERRGVRPDYVPAEYVAEALAAGLPGAAGAAVLLLRADLARPALRELLAARGARVDDVAAYRTLDASDAAGATGPGERRNADGAAAREGRIDAVTFTSPSTVRGYLRAAGALPAGAAVVCIGPITARAARELGLRVDAVAQRYTVAGLVEALSRHFAREAAAGDGDARQERPAKTTQSP